MFWKFGGLICGGLWTDCVGNTDKTGWFGVGNVW